MSHTSSFDSLMAIANRPPLVMVHGAGSWLTDSTGKRYLDFVQGWAVNSLGHAPPAITQALAHQAGRLISPSPAFYNDQALRLADLLVANSCCDRVFFANSGAEANEAALKMARLFASNRGQTQAKVIVMEKSFHGRTLLTVSATANPTARAGFFTLDDDFIRVPFGDIEAISQAIADNDNVCAVMLEPIQGESGVNTATNGFDFLTQVRKVCDDHDLLMILDEVQTGNGRTGRYFAYQYSSIKPDILTTAKGLGNGFPVGACMTTAKANDIFSYGSHGSTYGGTPLACRVVSEVIDVIDDENMMATTLTNSAALIEQITSELGSQGVTVRGKGMMLGVVMPQDSGIAFDSLVDSARDNHHLIINVAGGNAIRLLPPLNMSADETVQIGERLIHLIQSALY